VDVSAVPQAEQLRVEIDPAPIFVAHAAHRRRFAEEVASLDEAALATPSRCHKWSVADVLRHLNDVDGWMWDIWAGRPPPLTGGFDPNTTPDEFVVAGRCIPDMEVRDRFVESSAKMAADVEGSGPERWGDPAISPLGFVPWWLSALHVFFDSWLHERDCFVPLGVDVPVVEREATPVLAYILGLVGTFGSAELDAEVEGFRVQAGTAPVVVTAVGAPRGGVDLGALNDALAGRGDVEVLRGAFPCNADRLGALARFLTPRD
jgi:uncharacterized protein (TIGR03083 family)